MPGRRCSSPSNSARAASKRNASASLRRRMLGRRSGQGAATGEGSAAARTRDRHVVLRPDAAQHGGAPDVEPGASARVRWRKATELLAAGCVSHSYFEFYGNAIEAGLQERDWQSVRQLRGQPGSVHVGRAAAVDGYADQARAAARGCGREGSEQADASWTGSAAGASVGA